MAGTGNYLGSILDHVDQDQTDVVDEVNNYYFDCVFDVKHSVLLNENNPVVMAEVGTNG